MISTDDQEALFKLIATYLDSDVSCMAIGGTAMMFLGYKNTTKDIDLVFENTENKQTFVNAIKELGYQEMSLASVYSNDRTSHKTKPSMYTRGDERFDLFVHDVFGYELNFSSDKTIQRHDFLGDNNLTINIISKEDIVLLKAITGRDRDHEDIESIFEIEKNLDWDYIITQAIEQKESNEWILIDLEETMQKLSKKYFIKKMYFQKIYDAQ